VLPGIAPMLHKPPASGGGVASLTYIGSNGVSDSATVPLHASAQAGDIAVMFCRAVNSSGAPTDHLPSGWVNGPNNNDVTVRRYKIMAGILTAGDITAGSITGVTGDSSARSVMSIFRPNAPATTLAFQDLGSEVQDGNPSAQTIAAAAGSAPLIALAGYGSSGTISPRTWTGGTATEANQTNLAYLLNEIMNSTPGDRTVDMDDEGNGNGLLSCYLEVD